MNANSSEHGTEGVSRRSFIGITVGSIVMLPTVANAMLLPTGAALAETGDFAELVGGSRIHIVSSNELGLVVRDVTRQGDTASLVAGAYVKITSVSTAPLSMGTPMIRAA